MKKFCKSSLTLLAGLLLNFAFPIQGWAAKASVKAKAADPAMGLVYMSKSNSTPKKTDYHQWSPKPGGSHTTTESDVEDTDPYGSEYLQGNAGATSGANGLTVYAWAKPARGYYVQTGSAWNGYQETFSSKTTCPSGVNFDTDKNIYHWKTNDGPTMWDGIADEIYVDAGGGDWTYRIVSPIFTSAPAYAVTYAEAPGGTYSVHYSYEKTQASATISGEYEFYTLEEHLTVGNGSGEQTPNGNVSPANTKSYASDVIILSTTAANWTGWYENGVRINTDNKTNYQYVPSQKATITAEFKNCILGEPSGELNPAVTALGSKDYTITIPVTGITGTWAAGDFTINFTLVDGASAITKGTVTYSASTLTIPYTYNPTIWGGSTYHVTVTPDYGEAVEFDITASATEVIDYEARIYANGANPLVDDALYTGTLADMLVKANTMNDKPLLQLTQDKTVDAPLSFTKSMTFDINGKTLTSTGASAISIAAAGIDVKVTDDSYSHTGVISVSGNSASIASVASFTAAGKLTLNGGTLSATNTGGDAYGINVQNGSVFYQTGGNLTVTASGEARGVNVATSSDYATITGGVMTVSAPANAYGVWSAGQTNVDNSTIDVAATSTTNAYGLYVNGGVTTCNNVTLTAEAQTTNAYGAWVNAGRLNYTEGNITAAAVTSNAYGVHIANDAIANIQTRTEINVETGTLARGINNLGIATILNANVNVSATTDAIAVNSQTSAVSTTIEDGSYVATVATGGAVYGLHHQYGALDVDGGTFKGIATSGNSAWGACAAVNGTIKNATIWGETKAGSTAYGFVGGVADKTITLTGCTIAGQSATSTAYGIYSRTNVTANNCTIHAFALGTTSAWAFYAENGTNAINNCTAEVSANTTTAYGVQIAAGSTTISGGHYDVTAQQATASSAQDAFVYGLHSAVATTVSDAEFVVKAPNNAYSQKAYGAYVTNKLTSTGCTYDVSVRTSAFGVYGYGGSSNLVLQGNTITATTTGAGAVRGVYAQKNFTIDGDIVTANSYATDAYAMEFTSPAVGTIQNNAKFLITYNDALALTTVGAIKNAAAVGNVKIKDSYFSLRVNVERDIVDGYHLFMLDDSHPEYANGYRFAVAQENPCSSVCKIRENNRRFETLEAALQYTADNVGNYTIEMTQSYTLSAGSYVLRSGVTLLIPYKENQTLEGNKPVRVMVEGMLSEHMRLTLATGANLNVSGTIELGGEMYTQQTGLTGYTSSPYGRIHLDDGSLIQLNSGAKLYAWGFVTGTGDIKAKNGAEVHEIFQIGDMKSVVSLVSNYIGTSAQTIGNGNDARHFPVSQYFIQNIEAPVTYYYGAQLICSMSMNYSGAYGGDDNVKVIGTSGSFFMVTSSDESAWVRKSYDPANDKLIWEVNSAGSLGSISMTFNNPVSALQSFANNITINSAIYNLPIASNMKFHVLDGNLDITQGTILLPGTEVEVNKTASLTIKENQTLYVMDKDQSVTAITNYATTKYSPSWPNGKKPTRTNPDAAINVHGKIIVKGQFLTTKKSGAQTTDGANIFSNNTDAGTISYENAAPSGDLNLPYISKAEGSLATFNAKNTYDNIPVTSAKLKNGDVTYTTTAGATSGTDFGYLNNAWHSSYVNGPFTVIDGIVYAKPSEYAQLKTQQTGTNGKLEGVAESNHTYLTIADKILILQGKGTADAPYQWWEVEATATDGVFECKKEGYEGFYSYNETAGEWQLVKRNVTFYLNETQTSSKVVSVNYMGVPDQSVISTNPSKATTAAATYTFYGWKSSVTETEYPWTATLEPAAADMFYTPVFTETPRNYTITFNDAANNGAVKVETAYGSHPQVVPSKPATAQYTYSFKDFTDGNGNHYLTCNDLPTVTGAATYTANWNSTVNVYTVIFKDGEQTLQTKIDQPYEAPTAFAGVLPTKDADNEFEYAFDGWVSSQDGTKYNNGSTPAVSGDVTYTAHYATTPRYMITFVNYDGEELQKSAVTQGTAPVFDGTPRRDPDRDGYFCFKGWKNSNGDFYAANAALPVAAKKETYTAQFEYITTVYTITFKNFDGADGEWSNRFGEGETPSYDGETPLAKASDHPEQYYYEFTGWTPAIVPVTGPATYTAQWSDKILVKYTITFVYDGYGNYITKEYAYGATPAYENTDPTPHKDDEGEYSYNFTGWNKTFAPVTGDATYTAQFEQVQHQYTITFVLNNGSANVEQKYYKNQTPTIADPTKATDAEWIYTFAGWDTPLSPVLYDKTYTAQWNKTGVPYDVTFVDEDGTTILKEATSVPHAQKPTAPADPSKAPVGETFYKFDGWISSVDAQTYTSANLPAVGTSDVAYKAKYSEMTNVVATVTTSAGVMTPYTSFSEALTAANNSAGCTLKLYQNVTSGTYTISNSMTVDFNGKKISSSVTGNSTSTTTLAITGGTVVFNDATGNGGVSATVNGRAATATAVNLNGNSAKLTINGGSYLGSNTYNSNTTNYTRYAYAIQANNGELTINDGSFEAKGTSTKKTTNIYTIKNTQTVYINGGKFKATSGTTTVGNLSVANKCSATGGFFTHNTNYLIAASGYGVSSDFTQYQAEQTAGYNCRVGASHTLEWNANGGTLTGIYTSGTKVVNDAITAPSGVVNLPNGCTFDGWDSEVAAAMPDNDLTYNAILKMTAAQSITVEQLTTVKEFVIQADATTSGEVIGAEKLTVTGDAYFDYTFNAEAYTKEGQQWYAFGVPFQIDAVNGIFYHDEHMVLGKDLDIVYYDGDIRATQGPVKTAWQYVEDQTEKILKPGVLYLAAFAADNDQPVRFKKKQDAPLNNTTVEVKAHQGQSGDAGWNGIANPTLFHATIGVEVRAGQTYVSGENRFSGPVDLTTETFVVGSPVMVQVANDQSVVVYEPSAPAPLRKTAKAQNVHYEVSISANDGKVTDHIWVLADEDAKDEYTIGQDLAKAGVGTKVAQMWVNRYGHQLCMNTTAIENDMAEYPLAIFAPKAGEYTIALSEVPTDATIYLTENGSAIWNLNIAPAPISLSKGTENNYGLRLVRKINNVVTGFDEAVLNGNVQKVILNDHLYIIRDGKVYSAHGHVIK